MHKIQFYHTRHISGFPCVTLYINLEVAVMIVLLMTLCENIIVAIQRCYIIIAVINILNTFLENIRGEIS